jgi:hypothetical protein
MKRVLLTIGSLLVMPGAAILSAPVSPPDLSDSAWHELASANIIDNLVFAELRKAGMVPSRLSDDTTFLRRLSLLTIGQLPTADDVRKFATDDLPDKRARKIDELLAHELHAAVWATRFSQLTGNSIDTIEGPDELKPKRAKMWHDWLRARFAANMPYDELIRVIVTATSRDGRDLDEWIDAESKLIFSARDGFYTVYADRHTLDLFWRREEIDNQYPAQQLAERIASSFMGIRINCARCHDHPFDSWTQDDYLDFVAIFSQLRFDMSPALRARVADRLTERRRLVAEATPVGPPMPRLREVYLAEDRPTSDFARTPRPLGGAPLVAELVDYRIGFMDWLSQPRNPYFARNLVNRVWANYFGRGIVEPLDGLSSGGVAAHENLLDQLAIDFVNHGYDLRRLERLILNSTTWQLSAEPNDMNREDQRYFSRAHVRLPPPETIVDMWIGATGIDAMFGNDVPGNVRAVEIGPSRFEDDRWNRLLNLFGRPPRTATCDCSQPQGPTIRQTLALMSDPKMVADVSRGALPGLLAADREDHEILDELFLRTLSRSPTNEELAVLMETIGSADDRREVFIDVLWALVNSHEFITIH